MQPKFNFYILFVYSLLFSDPICFKNSERQKQGYLGSIEGAPLFYEHRIASMGSGYFANLVIGVRDTNITKSYSFEVVRENEMSRAVGFCNENSQSVNELDIDNVATIIYYGLGIPMIENIVLDEDTITLQCHYYPFRSLEEKHTYILKWKNGKVSQINTYKSFPYIENIESIKSLLINNELDSAKIISSVINESSDAYKNHFDEELFALFLKNVHRIALQKNRINQQKESAREVLTLFNGEYFKPDHSNFSDSLSACFTLCKGISDHCETGTYHLKDFQAYERILNDLGFFLEQGGYLKEAVLLLQEVVRIFPKRAVAYLNLADALWKEDKENSKLYYKKYIDILTSLKKRKKIPTRVFERVKYLEKSK